MLNHIPYQTARSLSVVLLLSLMGALGHAQTQGGQTPVPDMATPLARNASGIVITVADVLADMQRIPEAARQQAATKPATIQQLASNLLVRRILANEGNRDHLQTDAVVAANLAIAHDKVLSDARLAKMDEQNTPTTSALEAYARSAYKANPERFERPAQTRASHILVTNEGPDSLKHAQDLLAQLKAGASFEDMAKAKSKDPGSAVRGGDLGFFAAGKMVRPFEDALAGLAKPGDLSEPVQSQFGYHIIRLEARREKSVASFEEVKDQLLVDSRTAIMNEARVSKVQSMLNDVVFETDNIAALAKSHQR